jgi:plasmid stabilization system protein ParE
MNRRIRLLPAVERDIEETLGATLRRFGTRKYDEYRGLIRRAIEDIAADPDRPPAKVLQFEPVFLRLPFQQAQPGAHDLTGVLIRSAPDLPANELGLMVGEIDVLRRHDTRLPCLAKIVNCPSRRSRRAPHRCVAGPVHPCRSVPTR